MGVTGTGKEDGDVTWKLALVGLGSKREESGPGATSASESLAPARRVGLEGTHAAAQPWGKGSPEPRFLSPLPAAAGALWAGPHSSTASRGLVLKDGTNDKLNERKWLRAPFITQRPGRRAQESPRQVPQAHKGAIHTTHCASDRPPWDLPTAAGGGGWGWRLGCMWTGLGPTAPQRHICPPCLLIHTGGAPSPHESPICLLASLPLWNSRPGVHRTANC